LPALSVASLVRIYTEIVSDPLEATVEQLVEAVVEPAPRVETIEVRDFEPRQPRKSHDSGESTNRKHQRRYSPVSRKVGDAGERVVLLYERRRLIKLGRQDLADLVRWHGPEQEFCGWDITSFDDDGREFFIEVKSSVGKAIAYVTLTVNEWETARDTARRDRSHRVAMRSLAERANLLATPSGFWKRELLGAKPIAVCPLRDPSRTARDP
jgi:hypothetical protein